MSAPRYIQVAEMLRTKSTAEVAAELGITPKQVSLDAWYARKYAGMVIPDQRMDAAQRRELARRGGLASAAKRATGEGWDTSHGVMSGLGHHDTSGERCACGLRIDEDHQPESCDMRGRTARLAERRLGHWSDLQGEDYHW